jgi:hypothetical protein
MSAEKLFTPEEIAKRWDCHKATVLRKYNAGDLPGVVISAGATRKTIRFRPEAVENWEKKNEKCGIQQD